VILEILKTILLGIVEGITEWLPVSSTGHMILLEEFIHLNMTEEFMEMFNVVVQLGAIFAVIVLFFKKLWPFSAKEPGWIKKDTCMMWLKVIVAVLPAAVLGILFDDTLDALFYNYPTVAIMLIVYGVLFILVENRNQGKRPKVRSVKEMSFKTAFLIGMFQVLSLIPGTSRSGATILGGIILGCSRYLASEFSFFLAIPVMFGASLLKLIKFGFVLTGAELLILMVGMVSAFVVSMVSIKFLMGYVKKNDFKVFGYYRIVLGIVVLIYFLMKSLFFA
jgi:undecaprenyl-diphosphatase